MEILQLFRMEKSLKQVMATKDEHQLLQLLSEVKEVRPSSPVQVRVIREITLELKARYS